MESQEYKERSCAAIHDLSGLGKCSLTVALPVLSACGVETSVLPTAVLSTHTGGFTGFVYKDLTEELLPMARHWKRENASFSALYSGFLGSAEQIGIVEEIFEMFRSPDTFVMVDPVMGDGGKLYQTYTPKMADGMIRLCRKADIVVPNFTEACRILNIEYDPGPYKKEQVREILENLCKLGLSKAVLTGVFFEEKELGAAWFDSASGEFGVCMQSRIEGYYHGTGDLFSSTLLGGLLNDLSLERACALAVEFTHRAIVTTHDHSKDYRFGPKFEPHLPWLSNTLSCRALLLSS